MKIKLIILFSFICIVARVYPEITGFYDIYSRENTIDTINTDTYGINMSSDVTLQSPGKFRGDGSALTGIVVESTGNVDNVCRESTGTLKTRLDTVQTDTTTLAGLSYSKAYTDMVYAPRTATDTAKSLSDIIYAPRTATDTLKNLADIVYAPRTATDTLKSLADIIYAPRTATDTFKTYGDMTYAVRTATDSCTPLIEAKLNASSGTTIIPLIEAKLNASSGTTVAGLLNGKMADSPNVIKSSHVTGNYFIDVYVSTSMKADSATVANNISFQISPSTAIQPGQILASNLDLWKPSLSTGTKGILPDSQMYNVSLATATTGKLPDAQMYNISLATATTGKLPDSQMYKVSLTTATMGLIPDVQLPKISLSTATTGILPDSQMYKLSIATQSTGKLPDTQMYNISLPTQTMGVLPQASLPVVYSTITIFGCSFNSTDTAAGSLILETTETFVVPSDCFVTKTRISSFISGSIGIGFSTAPTTGGTAFVMSTCTLLSSTQDSTNTQFSGSTKFLPAGTIIQAFITALPAVATVQKVTFEIIGWRRIW